MDDRRLQLRLHRLDGLIELPDDLLRQPPPLGVSDGKGEVFQVRDGVQIPDGVPILIS